VFSVEASLSSSSLFLYEFNMLLLALLALLSKCQLVDPPGSSFLIPGCNGFLSMLRRDRGR
jgi:hypothetical protein